MSASSYPGSSESRNRAGNPGATPAGMDFDIDALFALASTESVHVPPEYAQRVEEFIDFVGCILGIVLSDRQVAWLRTHLAEALAVPDGDETRFVAASLDVFRPVKDATADVRQQWRKENQPRFLEGIAGAGSALAKTIEEWYDAARQVLAEGNPPLTREAAESWAELSTFATLISQGKEPGTAAPASLEAMIAQLAKEYPTLHPQQRLWTAFAPITLYEIRRSWPTMSPASRDALRAKLAAQFDLQPQAVKPAAPSIAPLPSTPAQSAPRKAGWDRFRDDSSIDSLQRQWAEAQEKGDRQKAADLDARIQKTLQSGAEASAMLSNLASLRMSMLRKTADNLRT